MPNSIVLTAFDVEAKEERHTVYYKRYKEDGLILNNTCIGQYHGITFDLSNDQKKSLSVYLIV